MLEKVQRKGNPPKLLVDINWHCHCGKQYAGPQKIKNKDTQLETKKRETELPHDPAIPFLDIYLEKMKPVV